MSKKKPINDNSETMNEIFDLNSDVDNVIEYLDLAYSYDQMNKILMPVDDDRTKQHNRPIVYIPTPLVNTTLDNIDKKDVNTDEFNKEDVYIPTAFCNNASLKVKELQTIIDNKMTSNNKIEFELLNCPTDETVTPNINDQLIQINIPLSTIRKVNQHIGVLQKSFSMLNNNQQPSTSHGAECYSNDPDDTTLKLTGAEKINKLVNMLDEVFNGNLKTFNDINNTAKDIKVDEKPKPSIDPIMPDNVIEPKSTAEVNHIKNQSVINSDHEVIAEEKNNIITNNNAIETEVQVNNINIMPEKMKKNKSRTSKDSKTKPEPLNAPSPNVETQPSFSNGKDVTESPIVTTPEGCFTLSFLKNFPIPKTTSFLETDIITDIKTTKKGKRANRKKNLEDDGTKNINQNLLLPHYERLGIIKLKIDIDQKTKNVLSTSKSQIISDIKNPTNANKRGRKKKKCRSKNHIAETSFSETVNTIQSTVICDNQNSNITDDQTKTNVSDRTNETTKINMIVNNMENKLSENKPKLINTGIDQKICQTSDKEINCDNILTTLENNKVEKSIQPIQLETYDEEDDQILRYLPTKERELPGVKNIIGNDLRIARAELMKTKAAETMLVADDKISVNGEKKTIQSTEMNTTKVETKDQDQGSNKPIISEVAINNNVTLLISSYDVKATEANIKSFSENKNEQKNISSTPIVNEVAISTSIDNNLTLHISSHELKPTEGNIKEFNKQIRTSLIENAQLLGHHNNDTNHDKITPPTKYNINMLDEQTVKDPELKINNNMTNLMAKATEPETVSSPSGTNSLINQYTPKSSAKTSLKSHGRYHLQVQDSAGVSYKMVLPPNISQMKPGGSWLPGEIDLSNLTLLREVTTKMKTKSNIPEQITTVYQTNIENLYNEQISNDFEMNDENSSDERDDENRDRSSNENSGNDSDIDNKRDEGETKKDIQIKKSEEKVMSVDQKPGTSGLSSDAPFKSQLLNLSISLFNTIVENQKKEGNICPYCGDEIHMRSKCPALRFLCTECNRTGHFASMCSNNFFVNSTKIEDKSLMWTSNLIPIKINNVYATAIITADCSESCIDEKLSLALKLKVTNCTEDTNAERICQAKLDCNSHTYDTKLLIINNIEADIILGRDICLNLYKDLNCIPPVSLFTILSKECTPISVKSKRHVPQDIKFISDEIDRLLKDSIIEPSTSPWKAQIVIINYNRRKQLRVDYSQTINRFTELDSYNVPNIDKIVDMLSQYNHFTKLDLSNNYNLIPIEYYQRKYTAFEANGTTYQFTRIPYGVLNGTVAFHRALQNIIDAEDLDGTCIHLDTVIIYGESEDSHNRSLNKFVKAASKYGLIVNDSNKSTSGPSINILGFVIENHNVRPARERLSPLLELPIPVEPDEMRRSLIMFKHYARWITNYDVKIAPLVEHGNIYPLTGKLATIFENIKQEVASTALVRFDDRELFTIEPDSSAQTIAATLSQRHRPVAFFFRQIQKHESRYSVAEREALAITEALREWRHYLCGRHFLILTDIAEIAEAFKQGIEYSKSKLIDKWRVEFQYMKYDISSVP